MIWRLYVDAKYCLLFQFQPPCISLDRLINYLLHAGGLHTVSVWTMHSSSSNLYANFPPTPSCLQPSESKCSFFLESEAWLRKFEIQSPKLPVRPRYHSGHGQLKLIRSDFWHFPVPTGGQISPCFTTIWTMFHRKYHHHRVNVLASCCVIWWIN